MNNDSPAKAILVVVLVAIVASALVSASVVLLRPVQMDNQALVHGRVVMQLSGLLPVAESTPAAEVLRHFRMLDQRYVDLDTARFVSQPGGNHVVVTVYLVWRERHLQRLIVPISGEGMWSTLRGYIALEPDLNTIADVRFYEQNETPGLGDQITRPQWQAQWRGRQIYDQRGVLRFAVASNRVAPGSPAALYEVDALTGATVTADAVTALIHHWFGPEAYQPFLAHLQDLLQAAALTPPADPEGS